MIICDKDYACCDYFYYDNISDAKREAKGCKHLIEVSPIRQENNSMHRYLEITVHDRDFIDALVKSVNVLYNICYENDKYPDEADLDNVRQYINHLCFVITQMRDYFEWSDTTEERLMDHLIPDVRIIDERDIPTWNNGEDIFMPLFDTDSGIILR